MTAAAIAVGVAAGLVAGMLGVGGGVLFVPALVIFLGLSQVDAEATSLLAIIPVAAVGAANQHRYGNLRLRDAITLGVLAIPGAIIGVTIVNAIPERTTEVLFALLMLYVAARMIRGALKAPPEPAADPERP
ncbi:MAG TPA: sulfite exporter TauE/SafE family protein [Baekduia sp.]